jgi:hypothetical protein
MNRAVLRARATPGIDGLLAERARPCDAAHGTDDDE